jgi:hypothetical protein
MLHSDCSTELLISGSDQSENQNLCLAFICDYIYYGKEMVDMVFAIQLCDAKFGFFAA